MGKKSLLLHNQSSCTASLTWTQIFRFQRTCGVNENLWYLSETNIRAIVAVQLIERRFYLRIMKRRQSEAPTVRCRLLHRDCSNEKLTSRTRENNSFNAEWYSTTVITPWTMWIHENQETWYYSRDTYGNIFANLTWRKSKCGEKNQMPVSVINPRLIREITIWGQMISLTR